jgi:hypothetical protein
VAEHQKGARSLRARDDKASKSFVLIHDLTHWLHSLEARREDLLRKSRLMVQGGARLLRATRRLIGFHSVPAKFRFVQAEFGQTHNLLISTSVHCARPNGPIRE